ncbi:MAG: PEGA domain-containing protein [Methanoregula sp.]|nr:PEGA domain-containing protein [Methanoregula sp.]
MKETMSWKSGIIIVIVFVLLSGCVSGPGSQKGTLNLTSLPSGSEIYLDNQYRGTTPVTIPDVGPGSHTLEYRRPGYDSWSTAITVTSGSSNYYAALAPHTDVQLPEDIGQTITSAPTPAQVAVTIEAGKKMMIIRDSNRFSGTASGTNSVLLTLYGPGKYLNGVSLVQQNVNELGNWNYLWNPGSSVESGLYTMIVSDPWKITSERTEFTVIGGGVVSISPSTYSAATGTSVTFSGQCTTGAQNVLLALYGPGLYTNGKELGPFSVTADKTWSYKVTLDSTMPTGDYTMYVYDVPKTSSDNTRFTVGYSS